MAARPAGRRPGLRVRAAHAGRICRASGGEEQSVSGMLNFMRNLGSSVGTSMVTTLIARRAQFHQMMLVGHASPGNPAFRSMRSRRSPRSRSRPASSPRTHAPHAYPSLLQGIHTQAATLAYIDVVSGSRGRVPVTCFGMSFLLGTEDRTWAARCAAARLSGARSVEAVVIGVLTIEREYGCGGGDIAHRLPERLGWALWDQRLTSEIARMSNCDSIEVWKDREERVDPLYYRLLKSVMRGSFEGSSECASAERCWTPIASFAVH